jgi:hypothetical protein
VPQVFTCRTVQTIRRRLVAPGRLCSSSIFLLLLLVSIPTSASLVPVTCTGGSAPFGLFRAAAFGSFLDLPLVTPHEPIKVACSRRRRTKVLQFFLAPVFLWNTASIALRKLSGPILSITSFTIAAGCFSLRRRHTLQHHFAAFDMMGVRYTISEDGNRSLASHR